MGVLTSLKASKIIESKRVLITAGASGIGLAIAEACVAQGARVHICDIDDEALDQCRKKLPFVTSSHADVADESDVETLFRDVHEHLGGLDALVNNAGIGGPAGPVETLSAADWRRCLDVCLTGQFLCTRLAVPLLKAAGGGALINMSSQAGRHGFIFRSAYTAAKFGVIGFTQALAKELGPANIRVNAILPGPIAGERIGRMLEAKAARSGRSVQEETAQLLSTTSMGKMIEPEEVAGMAILLISPLGSSISGQSIGVCGNTFTL